MRFFNKNSDNRNATQVDNSVFDSDGEMDEDGYWGMLGSTSKRELVGRLVRDLVNIPRRVFGGRGREYGDVETGTLILVRHGESLWNANKTFTGELLFFCCFCLFVGTICCLFQLVEMYN